MLDWRAQQQSVHLPGGNATCRAAFQQLGSDSSPNEKWGVSEKTQLPLSQSEQTCELAHRGQRRTRRNDFPFKNVLNLSEVHLSHQTAPCQKIAFPEEEHILSFQNLLKVFCLPRFQYFVKDKTTDGRDRWDDNNGSEAMKWMNNMQHSILSSHKTQSQHWIFIYLTPCQHNQTIRP